MVSATLDSPASRHAPTVRTPWAPGLPVPAGPLGRRTKRTAARSPRANAAPMGARGGRQTRPRNWGALSAHS
eukprot:8441859-Lingulodinium_polyedra.AAC.1